MNILFWNLKGNSISGYIKQCLVENSIDIALFSEYNGVDFAALEREMEFDYRYIEGMGGCDKIALFISSAVIATINREQSRYVLYTIQCNGSKYIVAGVHLQDRRSNDAAVRIETVGRLMNDIKNLEQSSKCRNTIVIGDFNANPYDDEMLQMNAFHAVLFKEVIRKSETRTVSGRAYRRLYNPIIHFISENNQNYGSFYYSNGSSTPVWHCLDQVLVGKALIDGIKNLQYLKSIGKVSLLKKIVPDKKISDHLPLFVQLT